MLGHLVLLSVLTLNIRLAAIDEPISVRVIGVHDGDTISVLSGREEQRVRLYGIDAPELGQPHGSVAKNALSDLVFGKDVQISVIGVDRFGRKIGRVWVSEDDINLQLVRAGLSWWYAEFAPDDTSLRDAENAAREAKVGLWKDAEPIPPWEWRKQKRRGNKVITNEKPLEDGTVTISRSAGKVTLPCAVMLVAAMNPCPCGFLGDTKRECRCSPSQIQRYRARISGPLLDRIDIHIEAPALGIDELRSTRPAESSAAIRARVEAARAAQQRRFAGTTIRANARMPAARIRTECALDGSLGDMLQHAMEQLSLSARAYDRILKVARTIADLSGSDRIAGPHLMEAIQYRSLDRNVFY